MGMRVFLRCVVLSAVLAAPHAAYPQRPVSPVRSVDFANFTYPALWTQRPFRLKNGRHEFEHEHCFTEYELKGVRYLDLTGDGKEEAVAEVADFTACGSSYSASYLYVFTMRNGRPRLLRKLSLDYDPDERR